MPAPQQTNLPVKRRTCHCQEGYWIGHNAGCRPDTTQHIHQLIKGRHLIAARQLSLLDTCAQAGVRCDGGHTTNTTDLL